VSSPNPHAIDADTLSGMKPLRKVVYSIGSNLAIGSATYKVPSTL
jgi:2-amino-4-hydroxy-6-hydroxymethyldihydropteridine diphosphokinase